MDHNGTSAAAAQRICERLANRIGHHTYDMWFGEAARLHVVGEHVHVAAGSRFVADWIDGHFRHALDVTARETLGDQAQVDLRVAADGRRHRDSSASGTGNGAALPRPARRWRRIRSGGDGTAPLTALRRLDDFVVGECNQLAFTAAQRIARGEPGARVLFLHGDCGVGKTHLLQGVGHAAALSAGRPGGGAEGRSRYLTAEQFTNEYIGAARGASLDTFRKRMRRLDLLAVDDVQFFANKTATQREFLHTVEALELSGARLALAADEHPLRLGFGPALASRLAAAMVARVERPDRSTRVALLRRLSESRGLTLSAIAADAAAARCSGSVRDLEGAVNKLAALRALANGAAGDEVGVVLVEQLFRDGGWRPRTPLQADAVIEAVCLRISVSRSDLMGTCRERRVVVARGLVAYLARELTALSYPEIAQALGRRHHSTIHTAVGRITRQVGTPLRVEVAGGRSLAMSDLVDQLRHEILKSARK